MIKPTVGRIVWFIPSKFDDKRDDRTQPLAATVVRVWHERLVNLRVISQSGSSEWGETSVALLQEEDKPLEGGRYAMWMPYQIGQSKAPHQPTVDKTPPTEAELVMKATAPRVTAEDIEGEIYAEQYHVFPATTTTVACLTLKSGFTVVGSSACASPENFDLEIGKRLARGDAVRQIWALEGYRLKCKLAEGKRGENRG